MDEPHPDRSMPLAALRGFRCRCPNCGEGRMFDGYLKVRQSCDACGQELYHHRADDGPPYLTLLIVGHIVGPLMLWAYIRWEPTPLTFIALFGGLSVVMSLWFLPRLKGLIVGVQWAARMYGFDAAGAEARPGT